MKFIGGVVSEKGDFRQKNQDRAALFVPSALDGHIAVGCVFDGIGSFADSEISAEMMIQGIDRWIRGVDSLYPSVYDAGGLADDLYETIVELNEIVAEYREENNVDIGCTMSAILAIEGEFFIFHMGDSRIYRVSDELELLSRDEVTIVERDGKARSLLANYIGKTKDAWINRYAGTIEPGDAFMICSDGLYKKITSEDINKTIVKGKNSAAIGSLCKTLVDTVYQRGERDNVSCVIISAGE